MPDRKTPVKPNGSLAAGTITTQIVLIRNQKVLLDNNLAELYGVATRVLLQAVKRNQDRFPEDFMFQLDTSEWDALRSQSVTSNMGGGGRGGRRYAPYAFTEQGVAMLSSVLSSPQAIAVNIEIMRAFVRLREVMVSNKDLAHRLDELESKAELVSLQHDTFARNTRIQLKQVFEAIRQLMTPPPTPPKRSIGFIIPEEKPPKPKAIKAKR